MPGQSGANVTHRGVLLHHVTLWPYDNEHLLTFLDALWDVLLGHEKGDHKQGVHKQRDHEQRDHEQGNHEQGDHEQGG